MKEHWFRWHHGTAADPKWRVVASRAGHATSRRVTIAEVLAVWACMLECASQASPRGVLAGWCDEDIGVALDIDEAVVAAIRAAMQGKTLDGNTLIAWEKRQPKREREDPNAAERKRQQRERDAAAAAAAERDEDVSRHVTPRGEERRGEEKALLSVGKGAQEDSREAPTDPPDSRAPVPSAAKEPTPAERVCARLTELGITHVNPTHARLRALFAAGVPEQEVIDAGAEIARNGGGGNLAYVCATVEGRRADAAAAPKVATPPHPAVTTGSTGPPRPFWKPPVRTPEDRRREHLQWLKQELDAGRMTKSQYHEQARMTRAIQETPAP